MYSVSVGTGGAVPDDVLRLCLVAATAAPSVHNTQPWLFRVRRGAVEVLVDHERQLHSLDPDGREMYVSVGAAAFTLTLALRARGFAAEVELLPDGRPERSGPAPSVAARVMVLRPTPVLAPVRELAVAIPNRHTNRRPFADRPVPAPVLAELATAAQAEGATMFVTDPDLREAVVALTRTAERRLREDPGYLTELARWSGYGGPGRRDGVPRQALGPRATDGALPLRDFALATGAPTSVVDFERKPTIALLLTAGDRPADWLRAGAALQAVLLTATVLGLAATPLSALTEVPALRGLLTGSAPSSGEASGHLVQTVLRIGYALHPAAPTPRRDLSDLLLPG
jgi:nitroreductase